MPVVRAFKQIPIQLEIRICQCGLIIRIVPGFRRAQKLSGTGQIPDPPASKRFMVQHGIMVIPLIFQFPERLITDEIQTSHSLIDPVIEGGIGFRGTDFPRHCLIAAVKECIIRFQIGNRISIRIGIQRTRLCNRCLQHGFQTRIMINNGNQIPGDLLMFFGLCNVCCFPGRRNVRYIRCLCAGRRRALNWSGTQNEAHNENKYGTDKCGRHSGHCVHCQILRTAVSQ